MDPHATEAEAEPSPIAVVPEPAQIIDFRSRIPLQEWHAPRLPNLPHDWVFAGLMILCCSIVAAAVLFFL